MAVWSGDSVKMDEEGYLYFVGRNDDMIKTSGYRVSPTEIEELAFAVEDVLEAAAIGVPHPSIGQSIVLVAKSASGSPDTEALLNHYRSQVPAFMVPRQVHWLDSLPRNPNGKIDRKALVARFTEPASAEVARANLGPN
jgi:acyl-coenzyme A synthetase/AMP-(fatty) acid ligase